MWAEIEKKALSLKSKVAEELSVWSKPKYSDEFANYIDSINGIKAPKERKHPRRWEPHLRDKVIKDSDINNVPSQMKRQEDQNCSTAIMEYANNINGGDKNRSFYETQAKERFNRNVLEEALTPGQVETMVTLNFDRNVVHENAIKAGDNYDAALDAGYAVMTNLEAYHAKGYPEGTRVMHNVLVVGYNENNYIYMDPATGNLMELSRSNFNSDNWYVYNLVITGIK